MWSLLVIFMSVASAGNAINRPVYKIVLTQKGFAQFLQYDVETPPLREFTFCTWIRLYDLENDQSILTYVVQGHRVVRLWLDSGGRYMKISIDGKVKSRIAADIVKDAWHHICLSYQSDFGAWALYIDSRLASCEAAQSLYGFILPSGGSIIIGYGTADSGAANGLEGEIFGANMILTSTIEKNYTTRQNPSYEQKPFRKNKIKGNNDHMNYVVLSDLQMDEIHNNFDKTLLPSYLNSTRSYIKVKIPYSYVEHDAGIELSSKKPKLADTSNEKEIFDFGVTDAFRTTSKDKINFWSIVNQAGHNGKFRVQPKRQFEQSGSSTRGLPLISEYETPPPPPSTPNNQYLKKYIETYKPTLSQSIYKIHEDSTKADKNILTKNQNNDEIYDYETPPPLDKKAKVYGQWTSSQFAGNVLNYLKSINFQGKDPKKIPQTIPLTKFSDTYPYASEFKVTKLRPPAQFQRRNIVEKRSNINKRNPQINVQILEDDLRSNILKLHAQTQPQNVEIVSRGLSQRHNKDHRFYRNVNKNQDSYESLDSSDSRFKRIPFDKSKIKNNLKYSSELNLQSQHFMSILPFLKSLEYFMEDSNNTETEKVVHSDDMYSKSLSNGNKWHNVKSYSNDYTPRKLNTDQSDNKNKYPSIRMKYIHENHKLLRDADDVTIIKGRGLAMAVSNQSDFNKDSISILKYNHGYLPGHDRNTKVKEKLNSALKVKYHVHSKNNFNKNVKLGNALYERHFIGIDDKQRKQSFIGGDESVPDINRYRSYDDEYMKVPPSLGPRVCKNVELYDRVLYVQQDESIDMTHILSPVRAKNIAIEFILQNYKKCSLIESALERNLMLFIDWSKTPVRLFGGAYPKTTTDLCGFF